MTTKENLLKRKLEIGDVLWGLWNEIAHLCVLNAELVKALDALEDAWINSDAHPRHAYGTCKPCDEVDDKMMEAAGHIAAQAKLDGPLAEVGK